MVLLLSAGCASSPAPVRDPLTRLRDPRLNDTARLEAMREAWGSTPAGPARAGVREAMESLAWSPAASDRLRLEILRTLLDDGAEREQTRAMLRLLLPRERSFEVVELVSAAAVEHGWEEFVPSLVRSLARPRGGDERQRPEARAIAALRPGVSLERAVYEVFLNPPDEETTYGYRWDQALRSDAWDVLCRLDTDGTLRPRLLDSADEVPQTEGAAPARLAAREVLAQLRACLADLGTLPASGPELAWLGRLRDSARQDNAAWWASCARAIANLNTEQAKGLGLRHAEAVRWAATHRAEWVSMTRAQLLERLEARLHGREIHRRNLDARTVAPAARETLTLAREQMSWGDALAVLVADEAMASPEVIAAMFRYEKLDRQDRTTEYGGVLQARGDGTFLAALYPPRPAQRSGDERFVASTDMLAGSDTALAHFHFHATTERNGAFAGPGAEDLEYAQRQGRTCLVLTSLGRGVMGVDVYGPGPFVLDLGEIASGE